MPGADVAHGERAAGEHDRVWEGRRSREREHTHTHTHMHTQARTLAHLHSHACTLSPSCPSPFLLFSLCCHFVPACPCVPTILRTPQCAVLTRRVLHCTQVVLCSSESEVDRSRALAPYNTFCDI
eukprot:3053446-Rhodomonas_salina.3